MNIAPMPSEEERAGGAWLPKNVAVPIFETVALHLVEFKEIYLNNELAVAPGTRTYL